MSKKHPTEDILALYASGDLDFTERLSVAMHVRGCGPCGQQVSNYKAIRADLASVAERHADPLQDWDRIADEMAANIRLGISMAECVGPVSAQRRRRFEGFLWRPPVMATGALLLFAAAFVMNMPVDRIWNQLTQRNQQGLVLESSASGLEMRRDGRSIISVRPTDRKLSHGVAANLDGSMSAGYVDDETGQVTIINVAGQ